MVGEEREYIIMLIFTIGISNKILSLNNKNKHSCIKLKYFKKSVLKKHASFFFLQELTKSDKLPLMANSYVEINNALN